MDLLSDLEPAIRLRASGVVRGLDRVSRLATARNCIAIAQEGCQQCRAPYDLFVDDALDLGRRRNSVGRLIVAAVVSRLFALPFHFLVAVVGFPDALAFFLVVFARDRNHRHVVVFVFCQGESPMRRASKYEYHRNVQYGTSRDVIDHSNRWWGRPIRRAHRPLVSVSHRLYRCTVFGHRWYSPVRPKG